jgi:hypothetical protein
MNSKWKSELVSMEDMGADGLTLNVILHNGVDLPLQKKYILWVNELPAITLEAIKAKIVEDLTTLETREQVKAILKPYVGGAF